MRTADTIREIENKPRANVFDSDNVAHGPKERAMTTAEAIREMLDVWDCIMKRAKMEFPDASEKDLCQIVGRAMSHALGLRRIETAKGPES